MPPPGARTAAVPDPEVILVTQPLYAQRYRLVEALPPGRALAVHRAEDLGGRPVVITVVRPADAEAFMRRMDFVAAARHLDLPAVLEIGRDGSDVFVVTEDVRGVDAATMAARGPLPVATATMTAAAAAAGLAALHAQGVAHGGVAPETLVQTADGTVKLTGAGLAAAEPPPDLRPGAPAAEARYVSPEEVGGSPAGPAADVYRLGLVLYWLLTGTHVFDGPDAATVAREQVDGVVQPPQFRDPGVPPALAQIVLRTLEKDPLRRGTAAQLQQDLSAVLGSARVELAPLPVKPRNHGWIWAVGVLVVVAVAALAVAWGVGAFKPAASTGTVTVPDLAGMTKQGAATALDQVGLKLGTVTEEQSDRGPAGTVISQKPTAGQEAQKDSAVAVIVSSGASPSPSPTAVVPDVVGVSEAEAATALQGAGFTVVTVDESSLTPAGQVTSQSPSAGVVAQAGTLVTIKVSTGPATQSPTQSPSASP